MGQNQYQPLKPEKMKRRRIERRIQNNLVKFAWFVKNTPVKDIQFITGHGTIYFPNGKETTK
jgi:hypothetical protein